MFRFLLLAGMAAAMLDVPARAQSTAALPDPLDARAEVPRAILASPLVAYRRAGETSLGGWRELNDQVARIGGWRAYAREAAAPVPAASAPQRP